MLLMSETLETIRDNIMQNSKIMKLMNLPIINEDDSNKIKAQKEQVVDKVITLTAQNPRALGERTRAITINNIVYDKYEEIRMTISILQGLLLGNDIFGNPRIEINIYYDNGNPSKALKILDLLNNQFSGKDIDVTWEDDDGKKYVVKRTLTNEGNNTQTANINNYEKIGVRFSFYAILYAPEN